MEKRSFSDFQTLIREAESRFGKTAFAFCAQNASTVTVSFAGFLKDAERIAAALLPLGAGAVVQTDMAKDYAVLAAATGCFLADCVFFPLPSGLSRECAAWDGVVLSVGSESSVGAVKLSNGDWISVCTPEDVCSVARSGKDAGVMFARKNGAAPALLPLTKLLAFLERIPAESGVTRFLHGFPPYTPAWFLFSLLFPLSVGCGIFCANNDICFSDTMRQFRPDTVYLPFYVGERLFRAFMRTHETSFGRFFLCDTAQVFFGGSLRRIYCADAAEDSPLFNAFFAAGIDARCFSLSLSADSDARTHSLAVPFSRAKTPDQKRVEIAVLETLGSDSVNLYADFFGIGGDALSAFELSTRLGIRFQTVYEHPFLIDLAKNLHDEHLPLLGIRGRLNEKLRMIPSEDEALSDGAVLLTGATGFFGSFLLKRLVQENKRVYCLVRSKKKLRDVMLETLGVSRHACVIPVFGDVTLPDLGIMKADRIRVASDVSLVIHAAANTAAFGKLEDYEKVNVAGTKNVLDFTGQINAAAAVISDMGICGVGLVPSNGDALFFHEHCFDTKQDLGDFPYLQSKRCAEAIAIDRLSKGMDVTIFRLGPLSWGISDKRICDGGQRAVFLACLRGISRAGVYHRDLDRLPLSFLPVDICAEQCVTLLLRGARRRVWHLTGQTISVRAFANKARVPLRSVSACELERVLFTMAAEADLRMLRLRLNFAAMAGRVSVSADDTDNTLAKLGFTNDTLPDSYFTSYNSGAEHVVFSALLENHISTHPRQFLTFPAAQRLYGILHTPLGHPRYVAGSGVLSQLQDLLREAHIHKPLFLLSTQLPRQMKRWLEEWETENIPLRVLCPDASRATLLSVQTELLLSDADGIVAVGDNDTMSVAKIAAFTNRGNALYLSDRYTYHRGEAQVLPWIAVPVSLSDGSAVSLQANILDRDNRKAASLVCASLPPSVLISDVNLLPGSGEALSSADALRFLCAAIEGESCGMRRGFAADRRYAEKTAAEVHKALKSGECAPEEQRKIALLAGMSVRKTGEGYISVFARALQIFLGISAACSLRTVFLPVLYNLAPYILPALAQLARACGLADEGKNEHEASEAFLQDMRCFFAQDPAGAEIDPVDEQVAVAIAQFVQDTIAACAVPVFFTDDEIKALVKQILKNSSPIF